MLKYGVRWDYDGVVARNGKQYHKYQLQPNAGKIPTTIKNWRDKNGGTHAVMGTMYIEEGVETSPDAFEDALNDCVKDL